MSAFVHFWAFKLDAGCTGTRIPGYVSADPFWLRQRNRTLFGAARTPPRRFSLRLRRSAATVPWLRGTSPSSSACCCCWCCSILTVGSCPAQEIVCDLLNYSYRQCCRSGSGIRCLVDPWVRDPGWVKNRIRDEQSGLYFRELRTIFWLKIHKFFDADPGSGMEKILIRDGKNSDPG